MSDRARRRDDAVVIRPATPEDNAGLVALSAACPMRAGMTLCVDRAPDFFALSRLQGDPWYVVVAEDPGAGVIGCGGGAVRRLWLRGRPTRVMYAGDFKLHPRFRGGTLADRILRSGWPLCEEAGIPSLMAALAGNAPVERRVANPPAELPKPGLLGTVRVHTLLLPGLSVTRPPRDIRVRSATPDDLDEMIALWDRVAPGRDGAPVLDAATLVRFVGDAPGLSLSDYLLAFRGGTLVGSVGVWNQDRFKETRVLDFGRTVDLVRRAHDLVARPLGWPRLPDRGQALRALHAIHLCVPGAAPEALAALLHAARRRCVRDGAVAFEIGLDPRDPLTRALRPFPRIGVDVRCYLSPVPGSDVAPLPSVAPLHFETALV